MSKLQLAQAQLNSSASHRGVGAESEEERRQASVSQLVAGEVKQRDGAIGPEQSTEACCSSWGEVGSFHPDLSHSVVVFQRLRKSVAGRLEAVAAEIDRLHN